MRPSSFIRSAQRGIALIDVAIAVGLIGVLLAILIPIITARQTDVREQAAAQHMRQFAEGAGFYIKENFTSLYSASGAGPVAVTAATIRSAGKLPSSFALTNGYGQSYCLLVARSPSATPTRLLLESFAVTEGGRAIADTRVPFVAAMIGAQGAAVENVGGSTLIRGAYGGFQVAASNYSSANCSGTAIARGHLASALFFDNQHLIADYLYRFEVPGRPEANTMSTNINMGGNNINNAGRVVGDQFVDRTNNTFQLTPSGTSNLNVVNANIVNASIYCDRDDPSYCVDPAGTSQLFDTFVTNRSRTVRLSSFLGNFVDKGSTVVFADGFLIKPTCPDGGSPDVRLAGAVTQTDTSYLTNVYAIDAGAAWQIKLTSTGGVSMPPGSQAVAVFGCRYI
jgi:competence protein ComGC